jgi:hypothetical protein
MNIQITLLLLLAFQLSPGQTPTIKGNVKISIYKGIIECDFTVTDYPLIKDYIIILNKGLNIRYFRNIEDDYNYAFDYNFYENVSAEGMGYFFPSNKGKTKFLPKNGFQISYVGAFPVISDTLKASNNNDWKGNIAFNGQTIRVSEQSVWYPVLYDVTRDIKYNSVKYDIKVNCEDCESLYITGSSPVSGKSSDFKSEKGVKLVLFSGKYKIVNVDETFFLNPDIGESELKEFGKMTGLFKNFYAQKLFILYGENVTYIQTTPISKHNAWLFVSYPTIVNVGYGKYGLRSFVEDTPWSYQFIAHEIAHYYFGTYRAFNSEMGDMITESFAEYLSMKSSRTILGDSVYYKMIDKKMRALRNDTLLPFSKIKSAKDYYGNRNTYVYTYAPLIYEAVEKEIGEERMYKWIKEILTAKADLTNYEFLKQTLETAVNDKTKYNMILVRYLMSDLSIQNAINTLEQKR